MGTSPVEMAKEPRGAGPAAGRGAIQRFLSDASRQAEPFGAL
jgi:hypothetical protein